MKPAYYLTVLLILSTFARPAMGGEEVLSVAVFNFVSTDSAVVTLGPKVAALINAELSADPRIITVERAELEKALGEQELGMSGTISPETAAKVGHLTGAKVLITGRVFRVDQETVMVSKIIGTETSRVYGEVVKSSASKDSVTDMASQLAKKISETIAQKSGTLVAKVENMEDRIEKLRKSIKPEKLVSVTVSIPEHHFGARAVDPAAQTEVAFMLQKCGFKVLDSGLKEKPAIEFIGEAFSELGMAKGNLVSCKARVELKAVERETGKILAIDRQTAVAVDLSEQMAGKSALQKAAQELAGRMIPSIGK